MESPQVTTRQLGAKSPSHPGMAMDALVLDLGIHHHAGGLLYGKPGGTTVNKTILAAPLNSHGDPRTNPDPVPCIPPYFALAFVVFIGY